MRSRDLTKGNLVNNLWYMAIPVMLGMVTQTLYDLVDMMWIGRLSAEAVAAVTVFSSVYYLVFVLNNIIGNGSVAVISQSFGSGSVEEARKAIANTFAFKLLAGIVASIIMYVALEPVLALFTKDTYVLQAALEYGRIRTVFLPIMFSSFTVTTALRCSGDSKSPMYITMFTAILNIILDPIFIFETIPIIGLPGLNMGVFGAALATVISTTLSLLIAYWIMFGPESKFSLQLSDLWNIDWAMSKRIIKIGLPQAISGFLSNVANVIIVGLVTTFGTFAIAAWGITGRLINLLFMPINGLSQGGSTIVGQNVGAGQLDRAEETGLAAGKLGFMSMLLVCAVGYIFAPQVISLFTIDSEVVRYGVIGLRAAIFCMPIMATAMGVATIFMGTGFTMPFLVAGIVGQWVMQIPLMFLFTKVLHLPYAWLPATYIAFATGQAIVIFYYYRQGKWRKKAELASAAQPATSA